MRWPGSAGAHRHRLPVLPPHPDHDRAGERRGPARTGGPPRRLRRAPRTRGRGAGRPAHPLSRAAVGRRAAARRPGPRARAESRHPRRRRADRQPRRGDGRIDRRPDVRPASASGRDAGARHPRHGAGAALRPDDPPPLGPRSTKTRARSPRRRSEAQAGPPAPPAAARPSSCGWPCAICAAASRGYWIFLACIALGVAAITGVGSVAGGLADGLARQGRTHPRRRRIASRSMHASSTPAETALPRARGTVSRSPRCGPWPGAADGTSTLVDLKAVDAGLSALGAVALTPRCRSPRRWAPPDGAFGLVADPTLRRGSASRSATAVDGRRRASCCARPCGRARQARGRHRPSGRAC